MKVRSIAVFILIVGVTLAFALVPAAGASPQADRVPLAPPSSANVTDGDLDTVGTTGQLLYEKPAAPFIAPPEVWVDDNYDDSTCTTAGHTWGTDCFAVIQDGINAVDAGGTVHVAAGTYVENVVVSKAVNLSGAGAGSTIVMPAVSNPNPCTGSSLCGGAASNVFLIQANSVVIHDLTVDGDNPGLTSVPSYVRNGADLDARNGIIKNTDATYNGLEVYNVTVKNVYLRGVYSTGGTFNFHDNTVDNVAGDDYSIAIFNFGGSGTIANNSVSRANDAIAANWSTGTQFLNNTITASSSGVHTDNNGGSGGVADVIRGNNVSNGGSNAYGVWAFFPYVNTIIDNNAVTNVDVALFAWGGAGGTAQFTKNVANGQLRADSVCGYVTTGLTAWPYLANMSASFVGNELYNCVYAFAAEAETGYQATVVASSNSLHDNTNGMSVQGAGAISVDASGNWWGSNIPGTVKAAANGGSVVDYTPWLGSGTDTDLVTAGFQGDFSSLWVDDDSPQTGSTGRIQEGVNLVSGSTVNVAAGTYNENVSIAKSVALEGAQFGVSVSGRTAASAGESTIQGLVTIDASTVEIDGFTLTNPGQTYAMVVAKHTPSHSAVGITHNVVDNVGSVALASNVHAVNINSGPDSVTVAHNRFNNIKANTKSVSAIGVLDSASTDPSTGLVIEDNTFTDIASTTKGAYGIILNNGAGVPGVQILNNSFSGLSGGWTHAIGLEGPTPNAVVSGNVFSALTAAGADNVAVHFEKNAGGATATVSHNQFNGGGYYGVALNPGDMAGGANGLCYTVNAENNWWNSADGPTGAGAALAGPQVDYSPWWTNAAGTATASGDSSPTFVVPAGATTALQNTIIACAAGKTVTYAGNPSAGGVIVTANGVTIDLNGATVGHGSPAFTIVGDDVVLENGILDGASAADPGVLVTDGADNFILQNMEIKNWADGVEVAGSHESLKIVDNWIHLNTDAGLQVDTGASLSGVVTVEGNLFKVNGVGISSAVALDAEYNSWGTKAAPATMANVDADPWNFSEIYFDVDPTTTGDQYVRHVNETNSFDVTLMAEAENLYGLSFKFAYDAAKLTLNSKTLQGVWAGACAELPPTPGTVAYRCTLTSGPEWDGGAIATFNFTANALPAGPGPLTALFDVAPAVADTSSAAVGGVKVWVNNAGFDAPSTTDRDISDADDGQIIIHGLANYTGFVDLQGRATDSGALFQVYNQALKAGAVEYARGTSASSGKYTTAYASTWQLVIGQMYWFQVDRALYLPTTAVASYSGSLIPNSWQHGKPLATRPLESVTTVVLLGGDATNDDVIEIGDAGCIGGAYGLAPQTCGSGGTSDVNQDGRMDILDLTLMGGNYGKTASPAPALLVP